MIFICLIVLAVITVLVMEQWYGKDMNKYLSDRVQKSVTALKP